MMQGAAASIGIGQSEGQASFDPNRPTGKAGRKTTLPAFGMGFPAARDLRGDGRR
jgi:hypothetical protein